MKLYFFRHAHAEDAQGPEFDDFTRPLSARGIERTHAAASALMRMSLKPARLYTSPRLRARQTADILGKGFGMEVLVRDELNFGFNPAFITTLIDGLEEEDEVLMVGHEPDFSSTIAALTGGTDLVMKKGGIARVDMLAMQPPRGSLVWLFSPRALDVMSGQS